ncbi:MAG: hypothetical protein OEN01_04745 [Candidatus Krumholzibacteria bacterium]|nr:hypothetical protein [Candidatus Krumholzibacteria bacterium]
MVALLVLLTIIVFLTVDHFVQRRRSQVVAAHEQAFLPVSPSFELTSYRTPAGVYFDPGHTWLFLEETGIARVGINEFAQALVGSIDDIATLAVGEEVHRGDILATLWHGDRSATFRSPIDGVVSEINADLLHRGGLHGAEPYTAAWLYKITPRDTSTFPERMHLGEEAKRWLKRELRRLKVFLATVAPEHPVLGQTMQDGGLPAAGLIDHLQEAEWNKLHEKFFG